MMGPPPPRSKKKVRGASGGLLRVTSASFSQLWAIDAPSRRGMRGCAMDLDGARCANELPRWSLMPRQQQRPRQPPLEQDGGKALHSLLEDGGSPPPRRRVRLIQMITEEHDWHRRRATAHARARVEGFTADANAPPNHGVTEDLFPPSVGMHVAIDSAREVSAELPDAWNNAIETKKPPAKSNVAEVTTVHTDGRCDVTLVCNCSAGREAKVQQLAPPAKAKGKPVAGGGGGRSKDDASPSHPRRSRFTTCL